MPRDLRGSPYLASEEELIAAGLGPCLRKRLTVTGVAIYFQQIGVESG